jgi:hypothetical protein
VRRCILISGVVIVFQGMIYGMILGLKWLFKMSMMEWGWMAVVGVSRRIMMSRERLRALISRMSRLQGRL